MRLLKKFDKNSESIDISSLRLSQFLLKQISFLVRKLETCEDYACIKEVLDLLSILEPSLVPDSLYKELETNKNVERLNAYLEALKEALKTATKRRCK